MASATEAIPDGDLGELATERMSQFSRLAYLWLPVGLVIVSLALFALARPTLAVWLAPLVVGPLIIGLFLTPRMAHADEARRMTAVHYDLVGEEGTRWVALVRALALLGRSGGIWFTYQTASLIDAYGREEPQYAYLVERCTVGKRQPPYIASNVEPYAVSLSNGDAMYFLPGAILVHIQDRRRGRYVSFPYDGLNFVGEMVGMFTLYDEPITSDAAVVGQRWLFERKDGGPDLRYRDNEQFPVIATADVTVFGPGPISFSFNSTRQNDRRAIADLFGTAFGISVVHAGDSAGETGSEAGPSRGRTKRRRSRVWQARPSPTEIAPPSPFDVLGVSEGATPQEIAAAYRAKAMQYHPDKVATLGPELRELAERKMKEINAAHQALRDD